MAAEDISQWKPTKYFGIQKNENFNLENDCENQIKWNLEIVYILTIILKISPFIKSIYMLYIEASIVIFRQSVRQDCQH